MRPRYHRPYWRRQQLWPRLPPLVHSFLLFHPSSLFFFFFFPSPLYSFLHKQTTTTGATISKAACGHTFTHRPVVTTSNTLFLSSPTYLLEPYHSSSSPLSSSSSTTADFTSSVSLSSPSLPLPFLFLVISLVALPNIRPVRWLTSIFKKVNWRGTSDILELELLGQRQHGGGEGGGYHGNFSRVIFGAVVLVLKSYLVLLRARTKAIQVERSREWVMGIL